MAATPHAFQASLNVLDTGVPLPWAGSWALGGPCLHIAGLAAGGGLAAPLEVPPGPLRRPQLGINASFMLRLPAGMRTGTLALCAWPGNNERTSRGNDEHIAGWLSQTATLLRRDGTGKRGHVQLGINTSFTRCPPAARHRWVPLLRTAASHNLHTACNHSLYNHADCKAAFSWHDGHGKAGLLSLRPNCNH